MKPDIRIEGLYDLRTVHKCQSLGIKHFHFDFRPRSFNFLQQYRYLELEKAFQTGESRYFHFENESETMVQKFLDDLPDRNNTFLQFSDDRGAEYYDQFKTPFYWHYDPFAKQNIPKSGQFIKGIILNFNDIQAIHGADQIYNFSSNLLGHTLGLFEQKNLEIHLTIAWDANIFPSLLDLFSFKTISLPINNQVEICYRNVNLPKVEEGIKYFSNHFGKRI